MDGTKTLPVYITDTTPTNDLPPVEEKVVEDEWLELQYFWDEEKQRIHDLNGQINPVLASSLEEHFLSDNYLNKPKYYRAKVESTPKSVHGEDIKDIPTSYIIGGFRPREHVVIGTYVDKNIIPGFRYKVRKNLTKEFLFDGRAKFLESVGQGYGKRLTFEGDTLNENENYFWSDSAVHGYAFAFQTLEQDQVFNIQDTKTKNFIGTVIINNPSTADDYVLASVVGERGYVEKKVEISFSCDVIISGNSNSQSILMEDVMARAEALVVRESSSAKAKISHVFPLDFLTEDCLLFLEE